MRVTAYQFGTVGSILTFFFFSVRLLHVICYITSYVTTTVFILPMYTKTRTYSAKQDNKTTPRESNLPPFLTTSTNIPDQANFPQTMHDTTIEQYNGNKKYTSKYIINNGNTLQLWDRIFCRNSSLQAVCDTPIARITGCVSSLKI